MNCADIDGQGNRQFFVHGVGNPGVSLTFQVEDHLMGDPGFFDRGNSFVTGAAMCGGSFDGHPEPHRALLFDEQFEVGRFGDDGGVCGVPANRSAVNSSNAPAATWALASPPAETSLANGKFSTLR